MSGLYPPVLLVFSPLVEFSLQCFSQEFLISPALFLGQIYQSDLNDDNVRFAVDTDASSAVYEFIRGHASEEAIANSDSSTIKPTNILFAKTGEDMLSARNALKSNVTPLVF